MTYISYSLRFLEHLLCAKLCYILMVYILHFEEARIVLVVHAIGKDQQGVKSKMKEEHYNSLFL